MWHALKASLIIATFSSLGWSASASDFSSPIWKLCAQSDLIVVGNIQVPHEKAGDVTVDGRGYSQIAVSDAQPLAGESSTEITIEYYSKAAPYDVPNGALLALDGKSAVLFLIHADGGDGDRLYFAGNSPDALQPAAPETVRQVELEIIRQRKFLANRRDNLHLPFSDEVRTLILKMHNKSTETDAFRDLEMLGWKAVPAIADLMADQTDLPTPAIDLRNPPGAFEDYRHYGPKKVVDALDAILNQITGQSFGNIENGGTEVQRRNAINGWRIYALMYRRLLHKNRAD